MQEMRTGLQRKISLSTCAHDIFLVYSGDDELIVLDTLIQASRATKMIPDLNLVSYFVSMEEL